MASHLIYKTGATKNSRGHFPAQGSAILIAAAFFLCCHLPVYAVTNGGSTHDSGGGWDDDAAIIIENADKISWATRDHFVELIGNVNLVQNASVFLADYVKITLAKSIQSNAGQALNADSVEMLEASGNIRIELDFGTTTSEKAFYDAKSKILVLTGNPAKFIGIGKNQITGSTITVNRETGTVEFERSDQNPVEGVIFPNDGRDRDTLTGQRPTELE